MREDKPVLDLKGTNMKYYFWDDGDGLKSVLIGDLKLC